MKKSKIEKGTLENNQMIYEIVIQKKYNHIDKISKMIKELSNAMKNSLDKTTQFRIGVFQYLIGLQYSYLRDTENINKYFDQALINLKNTEFAKDIQKIQSEYNKYLH